MQRKRRKKNAGAGIVMALVILLAMWLAVSKLIFVVRHVDVVGNETISAEDVIRVSGLPLGKFIGSVDETLVRERIQRNSRVKLQEIRYSMPDRVILTVEERIPAAIAVTGSGIVVLDTDCAVIETVSTVPEDTLLYVSGMSIGNVVTGSTVAAPEDQISAVNSVTGALRSQGAEEYISELNVSSTDALYLYSRTSVKVLLGDDSDMERKIAWAVSALQDLENRGELRGVLDVSSGSMADYTPEAE